eukprot:g51225.t1
MSLTPDALPNTDPNLVRGESAVLGKRERERKTDNDIMEVEEQAPIVELSLNQLSTYVEGEKTASMLRSYFKTDQFKAICADVFRKADKDKSGNIDAGELLTAYRVLISKIPGQAAIKKFSLEKQNTQQKLGKDFLGRMWKYIDVDKNGTLDQQEFFIAMKLMWTEAVKIQSKATGPDKILESVLKLLYKRFPKEQVDLLRLKFETRKFIETCERVFKEVDKDGNGRLDRKETYNAFTLVLKHIPEITQVLGYDTLRYSDTTARLLIHNTFKHLDIDGSGFLEWNEFPMAMKLLWCDAFVVAKQAQNQFA